MKKFLLTLFVGLFGFISFSSAGSINDYSALSVLSLSAGQVYDLDSTNYNGFCAIENASMNGHGIYAVVDGVEYYIPSVSQKGDGTYSCFSFSNSAQIKSLYRRNSIYVFMFKYDCPTCPSCPSCPSTGDLLSGYILESEIDTNYCVENGYCPNSCGSGGDFSGDLQFSNLYINNILHPGKQNIFVNIPDYIYWDYSTEGEDFNIYVGSGYDQDYIDGVLSINSYKPDSGDFTNIFVSGLTLIFPYIFVVLLILFIWKLLKRIFK